MFISNKRPQYITKSCKETNIVYFCKNSSSTLLMAAARELTVTAVQTFVHFPAAIPP